MLDPNDAPPVAPPNPFAQEPECTIDWTTSILHPKLLAAIARAQHSITTVGKEATATANNAGASYKYATADAVIGELRRAFSAQGVEFLHSFAMWDPPGLREQIRIGDKQWVDWIVRIDWCLMWGDPEGQNDGTSIGVLRGNARTVAIGQAGRPPDKSANAARTNLAGYVALGLGAIDRALVDPDEDVNQRNDSETGRTAARRDGPEPAGRVPLAELRVRAAKALSVIEAGRRAAGLPKMITDKLRDRIYGQPFDVNRMHADDARAEWGLLVERLEEYVDDLEDRIAAEAGKPE